MSTTKCLRSLVLADVENLVGSPSPMSVDIREVFLRVQELCSLQPNDLVIAGGSGADALFSIADSLPGARIVFQTGTDGADLALLETVDSQAYCEQFDRLVIASGDHIFAEAAARIAGYGLQVEVCARMGSLAKTLRMAAHKSYELPSVPSRVQSARLVHSRAGLRLVPIMHAS